MANAVSTLTISVLTRHSEDCPQINPQYKRCKCRKSLYIYEGGKVSYKSAKTRSWEQAERVAQDERDKRDPVKLRLREIEDSESAKAEALKAGEILLSDALNLWVENQKGIATSSVKAYESSGRKLSRWADGKGVTFLSEIKASMLAEWRAQWSEDAAHKSERMNATTQSTFQIRLSQFFKWAVGLDLIKSNPASGLGYIRPSNKRTQVLTQPQFDELLAAVEPFTRSQVGELNGFANELRALFLLQRWTGLRIQDCLTFPRSGLNGNRLRLTTKKTGADVERILPDCVVSALSSLSPERAIFRPAFFFWSLGCDQENLTVTWGRYIRKLNEHLRFTDEHGERMKFHSHMLRDTYAVEMLLAGVSLEDVSRLLTHSSIRTTERCYAHWVKSRRDQLEDKTIAAMRKMGATIGGD